LVDAYYLLVFSKAYLFTVSIEFVVCYLLNRRIGFRRVLGTVLLVNGFSVFIVWFVIPRLVFDYLEYLLAAEGFAVISETILMMKLVPLSSRRILATSFVMNMASFIFGFLFPRIIY